VELEARHDTSQVVSWSELPIVLLKLVIVGVWWWSFFPSFSSFVICLHSVLLLFLFLW